MKKHDAIIVLGGGCYSDGSLTELSRQRLDKGIELFKRGLSDKIIVVGGRKTYLGKVNFPKTSAELRKEYLVEKVKREDLKLLALRVVIVNKGGDTIPEAFAIREKAQRYELKRLVLVTSDKHMKRALWIFRRIFGDKFKINGVSTPCGDLMSEGIEREKLKVVKKFFQMMPKDIPDPNLETWFEDQRELYEGYKKIEKAHPRKDGKQWQAYVRARKR